MAGSGMTDVRQMILEAALDDWISDYEIQGDFQYELQLEPTEAYQRMIDQVVDWIRRGVLVAGDMLDGFVPWPGSPEETASRFTAQAQQRKMVSRPGEICWFDTGPDASSEVAKYDTSRTETT
jgi:hypothetical protein